MKITAVKITIISNEERLKAYASITLDDCFIVHDLKVIRTKDKIFVAMPSKADKNKTTFRDIAHPINKETRSMIQKAVFSEYEQTLQKFHADKEKLADMGKSFPKTPPVTISPVATTSSTTTSDSTNPSSNTTITSSATKSKQISD